MNDSKNALVLKNDAGLDGLDFDALERELDADLENSLSELEVLKKERALLSDPDGLMECVSGAVWDNFILQIGAVAGEDFIKENYGQNLNLKDEAHIQTGENFDQGKLATHNHYSCDKLKQYYERYTEKGGHQRFRREYVNPGMDKTLPRAGELNRQGIETVKDDYSHRYIPTATKNADGSHNPNAAQRDHVVSSDECFSDPALQMGLDNQEFADAINHRDNLAYTTAKRNQIKSNKTDAEMDSRDQTKPYKERREKAEKYIKQKEKEIAERLKQEGRKTQIEEGLRISGKALRAFVMSLLAALMKELIYKFAAWLKAGTKTLENLLGCFKEAIKNFIGNLKQHLVNATQSVVTTILSAIYGPLASMWTKVWTALKHMAKTVKEAWQYVSKPENRGKSMSVLSIEVGKIVVAGATAMGALFLGEAVEKGLISAAPAVFGIQIPLLGSLGNIVGLFLGAITAGAIGAVILYYLNKWLEKKKKDELDKKQIEKGNEILAKQAARSVVVHEGLRRRHKDMMQNIGQRHQEASKIMREACTNIMSDDNTENENGIAQDVYKEDKYYESRKNLADIDGLLNDL